MSSNKKPVVSSKPEDRSSKLKPKNPRLDADAHARDDCVLFIIDLLLSNIEQHIKDKFIFPRTLAYAVGQTMAEMVHMVSIAHIHRMEDWLVHLDGSAPEEWDCPEEPLMPLIDSWARGVVPLKKMPGSRSSSSQPEEPTKSSEEKPTAGKQRRRGSAMALSQYQEQMPVRRRHSDMGNSKQGLRGSLRKFSEGFYPLDANRKVKFQERRGSSTDGVISKEAEAVRSSSCTPPTNEAFQDHDAPSDQKSRVSDITVGLGDQRARRTSLTGKVNKHDDGLRTKALPSSQKKIAS